MLLMPGLSVIKSNNPGILLPILIRALTMNIAKDEIFTLHNQTNNMTVNKYLFFTIFWLIILSGLSISQVLAANYYVNSNEGNDAAVGTSATTAWKSIDKINGVTFLPGDSILFKKGSTWTGELVPKGSGSINQKIVFSNYGSGEKPHIIGREDRTATVRIENIQYFVFEGFKISHPISNRPPNKVLTGISVLASLNGVYHDVSIRDNEVRDVDGMPVNDRWRQGGIFVRSTSSAAYFDQLVIDKNFIHRCSVRGIHVADGSNTDTLYYHKDLEISNNIVERVGLEGIMVSRARNVLIEKNRVFWAGEYTNGVSLNGICIAGLWSRGKNNIIQYNEVAYTQLTNPTPYDQMDSQAFDIDLETAGYTIIQYNYSHDNLGGFFLHMGNPGPDFTHAYVRYNISQNDGKGFNNRVFELHPHPNVKNVKILFYNNTIYNNTKIHIMDRAGGTGVHPGIEFRNNIFYAPAAQYDDLTNIVYDHNAYFNHAKPWTDLNGIVSNPLLENPVTGSDGTHTLDGYKLQATSPLIGAGLFIHDDGDLDFWGNPVIGNGKPDIGAHQKTILTSNFPETKGQRSFLVYPNPLTGNVLNIRIDEGTASEWMDVALYNMQGKKVFAQNLFSDQPVKISSGVLGTGVYMVLVSTSNGRYWQKLCNNQ
jgi:hypothetical protein